MTPPPLTLDETLSSILARRAASNRLRSLSPAPPPGTVDFSSNDYLSLSTCPTVLSTFHARLQQQSPARLGSGGSRLLDGNSPLAEALEAKLAAFYGSQAALLLPSAYAANLALLSCVPQPGDVVLYDELVHASVHDGMRLGRAQTRVAVAHASILGGAEQQQPPQQQNSLSAVLDRLTCPPSHDAEAGDLALRLRAGTCTVFLVLEGVYSMSGAAPSAAALAGVVSALDARLPRRNAHLLVDEAHSVGLLGSRGRGLASALPPALRRRVYARVLGFGKALGCAGGAVLCSRVAREYLVNYARPFIYSTATGDPALVALGTAHDFVAGGGAEGRRRRVFDLARRMHAVLGDLCRRAQREDRGNGAALRVGTDTPQSPIIPVLTPRARSLARYCQERGYLVRAIVAPTVPAGQERIRICVHAGNTEEQVDGLGKVIAGWIGEQKDAKL
ncbi:hypothetical protein P8C59_002727 [Phyllachora maydis]|uniref:Aminotransferase class I/classII large domain-containing protein n=1 Tax=Phyllachora maydis TaxID=1825666 RepID=A0AAD9MAL7_9PEZI|nr:hypothetical protein P8C59_002727 [Phyllachora maydis]